MGDHGASDEFGKELGLIQEVVVTGRKLGAGKEFWSDLAHDADIFKKVIGFVEMEKIRRVIALWERFYQEVFGVTVDFSYLEIPGAREGFNWLIIILKDLTPVRLFEKCKERFPCVSTKEKLDTIMFKRKVEKNYAIWVRDRVEADEETRNKSADDCNTRNLKGITLEERLLLELFYHWKTGKHLDINSENKSNERLNETLCSGSRYSNRYDVPIVSWYAERMFVGWCFPDCDAGSRRVREVVE